MQIDVLREKADQYAHVVYALARKLPKDELFGLTSQLRRAALSVPLNIVEGYGRQSARSNAQFLTISFGSLKESQYLLAFAVAENYLTQNDIQLASDLGQEVARMLWSKIRTLRERDKEQKTMNKER